MNWTWYLFGFKGRINRARYWLAMLIIVCWMAALAALAIATGVLSGKTSFGFSIDDLFRLVDPASYRSLSWTDLPPLMVKAIGMPLFLWVYFAVSIKRLHDRNRSGWWMIPFFVVPGLYYQLQGQLGDSIANVALGIVAPILYIWGAVELYFLRGTRWTNQYGPNPLSKEQMRARSAQARLRATTPWDQHSEIEMVPHQASAPPVWRVKPEA